MSEKFETFRDHFLSLYQSAVTDVARQLDRKSSPRLSVAGGGRPAVSVLPEIAADIARQEQARLAGTSSGIPSAPELKLDDRARACAELAFRYLKAKAAGDQQALARIKDEFSKGPCDPAWAMTIEE